MPAGRVLSSLTLRGRCVVGAGLALLLVGALLGERALVQLAVFTLGLPLLSALAVARQRFRISARRTVTPARVPRGEDADVVLELANADNRPGGLWVLTEQLPGDLGPAPQFVVERLGAGERTALRYRVHGSRRGRHVLGPLRLRLVDPFGLVERSAVGADSAPLLVLPRVRPLGAGGPAGGQGGGGEGARRSIAVHGEDDVSTREYRHGDDLRKVHWRATARTGELMVRLEERPWRAQATLLVDTRARAHLVAPHRIRPGDDEVRPGPAGDDAPPVDSLEWLVEAAASIGSELARRGAVLRAVTDAGELVPMSGHGRLSAEDLLDRLAVVGPSRMPGLGVGIEHLCRAAGEGPVVCLLGAVGPDDVVELIRSRSGPTTDLAVLTDIESWAAPGPGRGRRGPSAASRGALAGQRDDAARLLRAAGWRVAVARADRTVAEIWAELGVPAPAGPVRVGGLHGSPA
ncbi:DUF58 domain-containing protein [Blastococcus haudaquaticus]|uniref:Uncharacterized conserved protein, DUF58 family, contains vWF domain n=1 Tax=Blastococcus haudaquaticus TaxID=1938745 RepID=A0A286H5P8_9ACTN|nr:DUF58 domain-containing protein [Blastococcus haudaquaticus]SOE02786.1 Uncharacterized conserved protein, DUF58 family, contains vWF domain [Blastococcus haudaquaticus]